MFHPPSLPGLITGIGTGLSQSNVADSCSSIDPRLPSANYWIRDNLSGNPRSVYCDNQRTCCGSTGGWLRLVNYDFSVDSCPSGWFTRTSSTVRGCVPTSSSQFSCGFCSSTFISTYGQNYDRVCGRIVGVQEGGPNGFDLVTSCNRNTINSAYVEGLSITHTSTSTVRTHIWTLANGRNQGTTENTICPCANAQAANIAVPDFVGDDYYCDTGAGTAAISSTSGIYDTNPLWDGEGCLDPSTCCDDPNLPWFCKQLDASTNERIEIRICKGFGNTIVTDMEIYIR